jgi:hypothetical protein
LIDIERRQANRLRVMKAIFDASGGSERVIVYTAPHPVEAHLPESLGLSDEEIADVCHYLQGEGLIVAALEVAEALGPIAVQINHLGIKEMEQSLGAPREPTQHFPPAISVINVHGPVIGSAIQSGSPGAQQDVSIDDLDFGAVREFIHQFDAQAANLDIPMQAAEELAAEIATIKAQLRSPKPKLHVIRESLLSARAILEVASDSTAAVGLFDLLEHVYP